MIATFQVHKQTYGRWPAKNGKPGGESFDLDLIDMSLRDEVPGSKDLGCQSLRVGKVQLG
jgi:hypothetical protein